MEIEAQIVSVFAGWNVLMAAMVWDAREKRIPNTLIPPVLCMGILLQICSSGKVLSGVSTWGRQFLLTFAVMYVFYLLKALGAGDVKLICALSSMLAAKTALYMTGASLVLGAAAGMGHLLLPEKFPAKIRFTYMLGMGYCIALIAVYGR